MSSLNLRGFFLALSQAEESPPGWLTFVWKFASVLLDSWHGWTWKWNVLQTTCVSVPSRLYQSVESAVC